MSENTNDLQLASMKARAFAFVIDDLLITFIVMIIFWDKIVSLSVYPEALMNFLKIELVLPLILLKIIYQSFFVFYFGATIGKIITKIRVIDSQSWQRVSLFSAIFRAIGRIFSEMFFYIGFVIGFFNDGRKTFHDITGKTLVVNA